MVLKYHPHKGGVAMLEQMNGDEVIRKIMELEGEQRIFVSIDHDIAQTIRYVYYKRQGLENLFLSYVNKTAEEANQFNLDKFIERLAQTHVDESDLVKESGIATFGIDLYNYLSHSASLHSFYIDHNHNQFVIYNKRDLPDPVVGSRCTCGNCKI